MEQIDWSKAPEGATHVAPATEEFVQLWAKQVDGFWHYHTGFEDWYLGAQPKPDEKYMTRPATPSWNGEGLPPVGEVCEAIYSSRNAEYYKVKILAHDEGVIVFRWIEGASCGLIAEYKDEWQEARGYASFRPTRTPEQIAAKERERVVDEMHKIYMGGATHNGGLYALYDAGYRKTGEAK